VYLSIAVEIAAMSAIAAASVKVKGFSVWFVFIIVTFIQFVGNIYFSYTEINEASKFFKQWVELTQPVIDAMGIDVEDVIAQKRFLALLEGGLLPLISLTCLHFFIQYEGKPKSIEELVEEIEDLKEEVKEEVEELKEEVEEINEALETIEESGSVTEISVNSEQPKVAQTTFNNVSKPIRKPGLLSDKMKRFSK
jgi:predicted PurR-regulated permease PerM